MTEFVAALFSDQMTVSVIVLLFALSLTDWILGTLRAIASHTFDISLWDTFIRRDLAGRVLPLTIVILLGRALAVALPGAFTIPGLDISFLTGAGFLAAVPYIAAKVKSIQESVNPTEPDRPPTAE